MANLNDTYPDLTSIYGKMSMLPGQLGMEQYNRAARASDQNYLGSVQDFFQNEQMNPLKVDKQRLDNQSIEAQIPGFEAQSSLSQDKARVSRNTIDEQEQAQRKKLIADMSDDDVKMLGNQAQQLAMSMNPQERAIGIEMLKQHKGVIEEKEKQRYITDRQTAFERVAQEGRIALAKENNAAGRYKKGGGAVSIQEQLTSGKLTYDKAAVMLGNASYMAELDGDTEKAEQYRTLANQYAQKYLEGKAAGGMNPAAGSPDLQGLGIEAVPPRPATPLTSPIQPPASPAPQASAPNAGDRVRVISKDGKSGTIPRSQLQQALQQGFKEAK